MHVMSPTSPSVLQGRILLGALRGIPLHSKLSFHLTRQPLDTPTLCALLCAGLTDASLWGSKVLQDQPGHKALAPE